MMCYTLKFKHMTFLCCDRWKDPNNEFRTSEFKLTEIPTILEYGTVSSNVNIDPEFV